MIRLADLVPGESGCPRVAFDGDDIVPCGLLWQHDGPCVPFVPGDYLPPPIAHPLDLLRLRPLWSRHCPMCCAPVRDYVSDVVTAFRGIVANWGQVQPELQITVGPCGCVMRILDD